MNEEKRRLGDVIFLEIEDNDYLNELHEKILYNYAIKLFQLEQQKAFLEFDLKDALRFSDLLSKSTHPEKSDTHKIIILLNELYPDNELVKMYAGSIFSSTGNY
jgi:hypothetical protein